MIKNERSPVSFPLINPYGHVVYQAQRGDVHTVLVNGRVVKHEHELTGMNLGRARTAVANTVDFLREALGEDEWRAGMNPEIPEHEVLANPYTYTAAPRWKETD
jgi:cytosine/adenosine deaminase-related metal-dependent hydrolase